MMWYDRLMIVSKERPRFWPFVVLAVVGLLLLGVTVAVVYQHSEPPAVELF